MTKCNDIDTIDEGFNELYDAIKWFVERCDRGEIRSRRTVTAYRELLMVYEERRYGGATHAKRESCPS